MSLYARDGDTGFSSTVTRKMNPKNSPSFSLLGSLEELNATLGILRNRVPGDEGIIKNRRMI